MNKLLIVQSFGNAPKMINQMTREEIKGQIAYLKSQIESINAGKKYWGELSQDYYNQRGFLITELARYETYLREIVGPSYQ